ncbi:subtilisin-like protein [Dichomitus squalens]|uniref:tripeptidyl-peptidase II n=1 Tax=Dichomitus squalens TaxID=114155 RepID=A0A4V2K3U4_9APHY|nr:subtilisin-like protein [Dichomitus squalens LYAD-421 SS1]EJF64904.1 subtilisin-like protein [Dichomitus squalens LYAD-421 SS1]TBU33337.1 subtilisin-like protein [Dichomitus squalens]TBU41943.1 subtilisin-like protein [Dichomitus squalens]TBU62727.1 subtilisin-like protein [Dichomitus squalens]
MALPRMFFGLAALVTLVLASGFSSAAIYQRSVPQGWSLHRRADPDALLPLKFSLAQSNLQNLEAYLLDIADPTSPNYGKHWPADKVTDTFRPSKTTVDVVHSWLAVDNGISLDNIQLSRNGDALHVNVTIAEAERILGAEYNIYRHGKTGIERVGCHQGYALPEHVSKHVDIVWPTVHFGNSVVTRRDASASSLLHVEHESGATTQPISEAELEASGCDEAVTIECLRDLYHFDYEPLAADRNTIAVAEFEANIVQPADLDLFFQTYAPDRVGQVPTLVSIENGTNSPPGSLGEATLDFDLVMGLLSAKQEVKQYAVGTTNANQNPVDELLGAFDASFCERDGVSDEDLVDCGDKPLPNVISISYHFSPDYIDPTITPVVTRQCTEIGKLSLRGITFVASSGDSGVSYGTGQHGCLVNGTLVNGNPVGTFIGQLPASCPFVTAVGATSVVPGNSVDDPEEATTDFPSGGGFSNNFARPSWQEAQVSKYLSKFAPDYAPDIFNRSGRAYPDVAANGWPTVVATNGKFFQSGGTSASAPIFASFVASVNDARIAAGKRTVGWINPALYSREFAHVYNDITNGTNPGCQTEGFPAAPGWDPVTGLGTLNFPLLLAAFLQLP